MKTKYIFKAPFNIISHTSDYRHLSALDVRHRKQGGIIETSRISGTLPLQPIDNAIRDILTHFLTKNPNPDLRDLFESYCSTDHFYNQLLDASNLLEDDTAAVLHFGDKILLSLSIDDNLHYRFDYIK